MTVMLGMPVYVNKNACNLEFVRWRKKHRKARINKKWQKQYGAVYVCRGVVFKTPNFFMVCPCVKAELERSVPIPPGP